jgi:hypothetical protein
MIRSLRAWCHRHPFFAGGVSFILFGGIGAAVAAVTSVTGSNSITCTPTTGPAVVCGSLTPINALTTIAGGNYPVVATDAGKLITVNSPTDATVTLPASGTIPNQTSLSVSNISDATTVPLALVGSLSCNTNPCSYTAIGAGNLIRVGISYGSSGTVSALTDSPNGDTCAAVANTAGTSGTNGSVIFDCPNIAASGAQSFTATISGSPTFHWFNFQEYSGTPTSGTGDQGAFTGGTLTAPTLATAGTMTYRGEIITAFFNNVSGTPPTCTWPTLAYDSGGFGDCTFKANGAAQYTAGWTSSGATYVASIAGVVPAHPVSVVNLCPHAGTTIVDTPTSSGCTPLPAGYKANIIVASSTTYHVEIVSNGYGPMDDWTASANVTLLNCRELMDAIGYNKASPIVITFPANACGPAGTVNIEQGGTAGAQMAAGTGVSIESGGGNVYTGGQFYNSFVYYRAGGGAINFGGTIANAP